MSLRQTCPDFNQVLLPLAAAPPWKNPATAPCRVLVGIQRIYRRIIAMSSS